MNKVDELAKIIETGLAEVGALYDVDFAALKNAREALAELVSLARPEAANTLERRKRFARAAMEWCRIYGNSHTNDEIIEMWRDLDGESHSSDISK